MLEMKTLHARRAARFRGRSRAAFPYFTGCPAQPKENAAAEAAALALVPDKSEHQVQ
jgi:hypothetical protein